MIARRSAELGMAAFTALFGAATMIGAREYGTGWSPSGPEPGMFPFWIGLMIVLASLANAIAAIRAAEGSQSFVSREQARLVIGFALPICGFVVASLVLGIYVGTALYMLGTLVIQNRYPWPKALLIALGLPVFFYFLIEKTFRVALLKGPLEAMLGL